MIVGLGLVGGLATAAGFTGGNGERTPAEQDSAAQAEARAAEFAVIEKRRDGITPKGVEEVGIALEKCAGAADDLEAAGIAISRDDKIYPGCGAVDRMIEGFESSPLRAEREDEDAK